MNICLTFDKEYSPYVLNLIASICKHNEFVNIYCIVDMDCADQYKIYNRKPVNCNLEFIFNKPKWHECIFDGCKIDSYGMYNTMYIATLLKDVKKVIYIDIDSIVLCSLNELWEIETSEKGYAAIPDLRQKNLTGILDRMSDKKYKHYRNTDEVEVFNNSVMVMDLEKMRKHRAEHFMHDLLESHNMSDMCVQNIYADGDWIKLDRKWCVSANYTGEKEFNKIPEGNWKILTWHGNKPWSNGKLSRYWKEYGSN
jgi:lipopolysaccharide biosynthesis glycosyltransferase